MKRSSNNDISKLYEKTDIKKINLAKKADEKKTITINLIDSNGAFLKKSIEASYHTNTKELTDLCNKDSDQDVRQMFSFYVNQVEILDKISDVVEQGDNTVDIVCEPEVPFKVFAVTRCSSTLPGHDSAVLDVQCSPDGRFLASGSGDKTVRFWDVNTETPQFVCKGHKDHVLVVTWSPCGKKLATGCRKGLIFVWDPLTGKKVGRELKGHSGWINSIAWKPLHLDGSSRNLASSSKDGSIRIWDSILGTCLKIMTSHLQSVTCIKWSGSDLIYSASQDRTIKVWDPNQGSLQRTLEGHGHWVNHLALNTDYVMRTGWFDPANASVVHKENKASNEELQQLALKRYNDVVNVVPEVMISSSDDFTMSMWKSTSSDKKPVAKLVGHQQAINEAVFSANGKLLASASFDKSIRLWSGKTGKYLLTLRGHIKAAYKVCWSSDSRMLCSASADSTVKVWNISGNLIFDLPGHADEVYALDWSPDGQRVVSGGKDKVLKIWKR